MEYSFKDLINFYRPCCRNLCNNNTIDFEKKTDVYLKINDIKKFRSFLDNREIIEYILIVVNDGNIVLKYYVLNNVYDYLHNIIPKIIKRNDFEAYKFVRKELMVYYSSDEYHYLFLSEAFNSGNVYMVGKIIEYTNCTESFRYFVNPYSSSLRILFSDSNTEVCKKLFEKCTTLTLENMLNIITNKNISYENIEYLIDNYKKFSSNKKEYLSLFCPFEKCNKLYHNAYQNGRFKITNFLASKIPSLGSIKQRITHFATE